VVIDLQTANRMALDHLESGADGILFDIKDPSVSVEGLLSGIELPFCSIFFYGNITSTFLASFARCATTRFDRKQVRGAAYGLSSNDLVSVQHVMTGFDQFMTLGLFQEATPGNAEALCSLLVALTDRLSVLHPRPQLHDAAVLISLSDDFFGELIRLRALDKLWACICAAYGRPDATLRIHGWSKAYEAAEYEPHGNMISSVSRTVSAVLGGAHVISTDPAQADEFQSRIARNVSFILQNESQLARVANPAHGSYFVEAAATKLAEEAWRQFQTSTSR
jgi:hypothetical protein